MLASLLTKETIQVNAQANDWKQAVQIATQPLIENGAVEPRYLDKIIEGTKNLGPYYVIAPGFAMPHARPEDGVNKMSLSLTTLKEEVRFGSEDNDPVKFMITLAATDSTSHIEAIVGMTELLENEADVTAITAADNIDDILNIIRKY